MSPRPEGREYAQLKLSIWANEAWLALSVGAKMLYLRVESHGQLSHCGVLEWRPGRLASSIDPSWTRADIEHAAAELVAARFVVIDDETEEILIRSHVRHDQMLKTWQSALAVLRAYERVGSTTLRTAIRAEVGRLRDANPYFNTWSHRVTGKSYADLLGIPYTIPHVHPPSVSPIGIPHGDGGSGNQEPITNKLTTLAQQAERDDDVDDDINNGTEEPSLVEVSSGRRVRVRKAEVDELFDDFWKIYPRRVGKQLAWRSFNTRLQSGIDPVLILEAAQKVADTLASGKVEMRFVPHPSTWLLRHGWEDETEGVTPEPPTETKTAFQRQIDQQREFMRVQDLSMLR